MRGSYRPLVPILLASLTAGLALAAAAVTAASGAPAAAVAPAAPASKSEASDPLPRRAFLCTSLGPVSAATRIRQKLTDFTGVEILRVLPSSRNLGAAWTEFTGYALAIWGRSDFISGEDDHRLIARIVNRSHPGHGEFRALDGIDHGFYRRSDQKESFENWGRPGSEFNPEIVAVLRESNRVAALRGISATEPSPSSVIREER
jgi:hypothetical protein